MPAASPRADILLNHPAHLDHHLFQGAQTGMHGLYANHNLAPDQQCEQLSGSLAAKAKTAGMRKINHVVLSDDRERAFAIDTADIHSVHARHTFVDVVPGLARPMEVGTQQVAEVDQEQQQQRQNQLAQQQEAPSHNGPRMG